MRRPRARRGAILIVVLALLALFAVIGISFVFYADSEATSARIHREGAARNDPAPPDATKIINTALRELIFDTDETTNPDYAKSPVRGHSLFRAMYGWGAGNPHPSYSYTTPLFSRNYVESTTGKGMNFPLKQQYEGKEVDLQALIVGSAEGLDENEQKAKVAEVARVFNDLLPIVPIFERYGNNPALDVRVTGYPPDGDPIYKNAVYGDNFVVMMIQDGTLKPKA